MRALKLVLNTHMQAHTHMHAGRHTHIQVYTLAGTDTCRYTHAGTHTCRDRQMQVHTYASICTYRALDIEQN